jgi:hypothetical protein
MIATITRLLFGSRKYGHSGSHRFGRLCLIALCCVSLAQAENSSQNPNNAAPADAASDSSWHFSLIPKVFQTNPFLDMTVITEMTDAGKQRPLVSPAAPVYYAVHAVGYREIGAPSNEKTLSAAEIGVLLRRALATNGYLPATPEHPPQLLIVYFWGVHNLFDQDNLALSDEQWTNNILERAALVGGEKFAAELATAIERSDSASASISTHLTSASAADPTGRDASPSADYGQSSQPELNSMSNLGAAQSVAQMNALMDPVRLFKQRSVKNEFLVDQASDSCYFVVASAYDYSSVATHVKLLLWRTRMTVNSRGVSQPQSLPTLVVSAAPYFGREMKDAETLIRRVQHDARVEIGTPTVIEYGASLESEKI